MTEIEAVTTSGRYEWDRLAAEAVGSMASSLFKPLWQTPDTTSSMLDSLAITPTKPAIDRPPSMDKNTFEVAKNGLTNLVEANDAQDPEMDIDELVHSILTSLAKDSNDYLLAKRSFFDLERKWSDAKEQNRTTELQNQVDAANKVTGLGRVEQAFTSIGLIATGALGLVTGSAPELSLGAIAVGSLLLVDQLLDDTVKKTVASWLAKGNKEETANWVSRIQTFCGLSSLALSLGVDPKSAFQTAINVAQGVVGTGKSLCDWKLSMQRAVVMELDAECKRAQKNIDTLFTEIQEICNTLFQFHENIHHIEEKRQQLAYAMLQF